MGRYQIEFGPMGLRGLCQKGESLLACGQHLGLELAGDCGGKGKCKACKVQVIAGEVSSPTSIEHEVFSSQDLENGWRLACQTYPRSDCRLIVPKETLAGPQRLQVEGLDIKVDIKAPVRAYDVELQPSSLSNPRADCENLLEEIRGAGNGACKFIDIEVIRHLSTELRTWNRRCRAHVRDREVVAISPSGTRELGMAVDLGSTKIAGYLVDLRSGRTLAAKGIVNPQISYGADIISRINYAITSPGGQGDLQEAVLGSINGLIADLCAEVGSETREIVEAVIVGNTAMHHLLLGLPVQQLVRSPFLPAVSGELNVKARDVGLEIAPGAYVHIPPNIAGFVGADHVAMLIATSHEWEHENVIALDIGTNTEISLIADGKIYAISCASGPAFEGYHIKDGLRATEGAIEKIDISDNVLHYQTIGEKPPTGICGSGILDAVAQLYLSGVLDRNGKMKLDSHPRVRRNGGQTEFVVVAEEERNGLPAISITQRDVREIQLAKAAIHAGIYLLFDKKGMSEKDIDKIIIAGAFGTYIDISNSITIGMLPSMPLDKFYQVGNAAGIGAKLALVSTSKRVEARQMMSRVRYIELASLAGFSRVFIESCYLEPYRISLE